MGGDFSVLTPSKNGRSSCGPAVQGSPTHDAENKIVSLPNLKSQRDIETTEMSVGDISPIKLVYSSSVSLNETRNEPRHHDHVFPPLMFPVGAQNDASVIPADWRDDIDNFNINSYRSNPFFVLRSSRKALENVKYLLPCLRLPTEVCQVNVSGYGSIRQYKEKQVRRLL